MLAVTRGGVSGQMEEEWAAWCLCEWTEGLGLDEGGREGVDGGVERGFDEVSG